MRRGAATCRKHLNSLSTLRPLPSSLHLPPSTLDTRHKRPHVETLTNSLNQHIKKTFLPTKLGRWGRYQPEVLEGKESLAVEVWGHVGRGAVQDDLGSCSSRSGSRERKPEKR